MKNKINNKNKIKFIKNKKLSKELIELIDSIDDMLYSDKFNKERKKCDKMLNMMEKNKIILNDVDFMYCNLFCLFDRLKFVEF